MPGSTPNYGWPYPLSTDPPSGHTQMQAIASGIDTTLKQQVPRIVPYFVRGQSGVNALAAGGVMDTTIVTLTGFTAVPAAVVTGFKGSANSNVIVEILTLTQTQLQFRVRNNGGSATTGAVHWLAIA